MTLKTVILPQLALAQELARECVSLGALGALAGPPGTGKTTALQHIEATYGNSGLPGSCVYLRAYRAEGGGRAIRDLLESLGVRGSTMPINLSLQFLIAMALKELQQREVSLIVVDEADAWGPEALRGFVSLYDAACQRGKSFGAILAGTSDMVRWLESFASALSRTLRCEEFRDLDSQTSLGLLREWFPAFSRLADAIKEKPGRRCLDTIYRSTGGNPRRLSFYARLHDLHFPGADITEESAARVACLLHTGS